MGIKKDPEDVETKAADTEQKPQEDPRDKQIADLEKRFNKIEASGKKVNKDINTLMTGMTNVLNVLEGMRAEDRPTGGSGERETHQEEINERVRVDFDKVAGEAVVITPDAEVDIVTKAEMNKEYNDEMYFMAQQVGIRMNTVEDEHAQSCFYVAVNGIPFVFWAGAEYTVPRYVVACMVQSKKWKYGSVKRRESETQAHENGFKYPRMPSNTVGFSVIKDTDEGHAWYKNFDRMAIQEARAAA